VPGTARIHGNPPVVDRRKAFRRYPAYSHLLARRLLASHSGGHGLQEVLRPVQGPGGAPLKGRSWKVPRVVAKANAELRSPSGRPCRQNRARPARRAGRGSPTGRPVLPPAAPQHSGRPRPAISSQKISLGSPCHRRAAVSSADTGRACQRMGPTCRSTWSSFILCADSLGARSCRTRQAATDRAGGALGDRRRTGARLSRRTEERRRPPRQAPRPPGGSSLRTPWIGSRDLDQPRER
jgi:hypothetical protein